MLRTLMTGVLALSMFTIATPDADACIHGMKRNTDRDMQLLVRAEKALRSGHYKRAFKLARRVSPGPINLSAVAQRRKMPRRLRGSQSLMKRATRVMAVSTVRLDGNTRLARKTPRTHKERLVNLEWAASRLRYSSEIRPHDAFLKTRLGEALAKLPNGQKEALELLESLAKEDLLADAHGYAAFATALALSGDKAGQNEAVKRCLAMASKKSICKIKPAQVAVTVP